MNRDEFQEWFGDLQRRLPEVAEYYAKLPEATRDIWFEAIFEPHQLSDALAVNRKLFETGEGLGRFEQHKLRGVFLREIQHAAWERSQAAEQATKDNPDYIGAGAAVRSDGIMAPALRHVIGKLREYQQSHDGELPSDELICAWAGEYLDEHDRTDDDPTKGPRYKCRECRDTGWLNYASEGRVFCGCCPSCDRGRERSEQRWRTGRTLSFAPGCAEDNPFNVSLAGLSEEGEG